MSPKDRVGQRKKQKQGEKPKKVSSSVVSKVLRATVTSHYWLWKNKEKRRGENTFL